jgi:hypothetical protein
MGLRGTLVVLACVFLMLGDASASSGAASEPGVRVDLPSEVAALTPGQTFWVGLH